MKMNFVTLGICICILNTISIYNSRSEEMVFRKDSSDVSAADHDGPYIFYRDENIIVKQIQKDPAGFYSKNTTLPNNSIGKFQVAVNDTFSFEVNLNRSINNEPCIFDLPEKLAVISDIEGNFFPFRDFLLNNGIINNDNKWIFGSGHLVLVGDFFDRGLYVTQVLWLIYQLEQEAETAGGHVHFILGNHEIMNMNDDIRYVRNKYFENAKLMNEDYRDLYKQNTELGRWLETKNIVEKIGNYLFLHGGISEELNLLNPAIEDINNKSRNYYYSSKSARQNGDTLVSTVFRSKSSPFWYRGYVEETIKEESLNLTLKIFDVNKIVVGHTIVDDVRYFYNGKVIAVDTDHAEGDTEGLLIENGIEYRVDKNGNRYILK